MSTVQSYAPAPNANANASTLQSVPEPVTEAKNAGESKGQELQIITLPEGEQPKDLAQLREIIAKGIFSLPRLAEDAPYHPIVYPFTEFSKKTNLAQAQPLREFFTFLREKAAEKTITTEVGVAKHVLHTLHTYTRMVDWAHLEATFRSMYLPNKDAQFREIDAVKYISEYAQARHDVQYKKRFFNAAKKHFSEIGETYRAFEEKSGGKIALDYIGKPSHLALDYLSEAAKAYIMFAGKAPLAEHLISGIPVMEILFQRIQQVADYCGAEFDAELCTKAISNDPCFVQASFGFMRNAVKIVSKFRNDSGAMFQYIASQEFKWPHSPAVQEDVESAGFVCEKIAGSRIGRDRCVDKRFALAGNGNIDPDAEILGWMSDDNPFRRVAWHKLPYDKDFVEKAVILSASEFGDYSLANLILRRATHWFPEQRKALEELMPNIRDNLPKMIEKLAKEKEHARVLANVAKEESYIAKMRAEIERLEIDVVIHEATARQGKEAAAQLQLELTEIRKTMDNSKVTAGAEKPIGSAASAANPGQGLDSKDSGAVHDRKDTTATPPAAPAPVTAPPAADTAVAPTPTPHAAAAAQPPANWVDAARGRNAKPVSEGRGGV